VWLAAFVISLHPSLRCKRRSRSHNAAITAIENAAW
jgi:hypothetical protein